MLHWLPLAFYHSNEKLISSIYYITVWLQGYQLCHMYQLYTTCTSCTTCTTRTICSYQLYHVFHVFVITYPYLFNISILYAEITTTLVLKHLDNQVNITFTVNIMVVDIKGLRSASLVALKTISGKYDMITELVTWSICQLLVAIM